MLGNLQVVLVGLTAWVVLSERPEARALVAVPPALIGIVLISGAFEAGAYGSDPTKGVIYGVITAISYTGFILLIRQSGTGSAPGRPAVRGDLGRRRSGAPWPASRSATSTSCRRGRSTAGCVLLALSSQVLGWLLITSSLPQLPAAVTSVLLTLQPLTSLVLGIILLGEDPTGLQILGAAFVLVGLLTAASRPSSARAPGPETA